MEKPTKYKRKAYGKIWNVLQEIEELRLINPDDGPIRMNFIPPGFAGTVMAAEHQVRERSAIIQKLKSLKAIRIITLDRGLDGYWVFAIDRKYNKVFTEYEDMYSDEAEKYETNKAQVKEIESNIKSIGYDSKDHILSLGEYIIKFKKGDSNQSELCRVLFQDSESINKAWSTDEMLEKWGWDDSRIYDSDQKLLDKNRRVVYTSASNVTDKVLKATNAEIPDLFTYSTKTVSITKKYRKFVS